MRAFYLVTVFLMAGCGNNAAFTSTSPWFIDATISAKTNNMDQTDRPEKWSQLNGTTDTSMELSAGSAKASIGCSQDGFVSTDLTCANGNGEIGMTFETDSPGYFEACIEASFEAGVGNDPNSVNGGQADMAIMIVQTGNVDHTPRDLDGPVTAWSQRVVHGDAATMSSFHEQACRVFNFNAFELNTLRLFYTQILSGYVRFTEVVAGGRWPNSIQLTVRKI